jgi:hypothetical protein
MQWGRGPCVYINMWREVLVFAQRPCVGAPVVGTLVGIDIGIAMAEVRVEAHGDAAPVAAIMQPQDCSEHLRAVVRHGGDAVRVDADLDGQCVARLRLMVQPDRLDARMAEGRLPAEAALVALAMEVWREARVPPPAPPAAATPVADAGDEQVFAMDVAEAAPQPPQPPQPPPPQAQPPLWRDDACALFPHQEASVAWMRDHERHAPEPLRYAGNLRVTDTWYIDTEGETFTTDPSWRDALLAGGLCTDGTGTGKTATALRLMVDEAEGPAAPVAGDRRYAARGTLVVLPLNLVSQWQNEVGKFLRPEFRALWLVQGKDVRNVTLADLCAADAVFTTFHFLRASKPYAELVDAALGGQPRTRVALSAWARQPGHTEPLLEAVHWRRVVVDEVHQTFESARDLRALRLLQARTLWGLTATPVLDTEHAQHLYLFLVREKQHHPNLLARLVATAVRGAPSRLVAPTPTLHLVQLSIEERLHLREDAAARSVEDEVKLCTFVPVSAEDADAPDAETLEAHFRAAREHELATLRAKAEGHDRAVGILERASEELEAELQALAGRCAMGDPLANAQAEAARASVEAHARDLARARLHREAAHAKAERCAASAAYVRERIAALRAQEEACAICMARASGVITPCAHLFCTACIRKHVARNGGWCPACRAPLALADCTGVALGGGIGSKMARVGELLVSLAGEPVILFVQWRQMRRGVAAYLRGLRCRVLQLDGNAAQRAATLADFAGGGVLLLCLEDSFAGLHLPMCRHCVFAHAIVGDRARVEHLERQAIARCVRHGQTGEVRAYSFVVADCAEEAVWRRTHE